MGGMKKDRFFPLVLLSLVIAWSPAPAAGADYIRVLLLEDAAPRQLKLSANGGEIQLFAGDFTDPLVTVSGGSVALVSRAGDQLHVKVGELKLYATSLRVEPVGSAEIHVSVTEGRRLIDPRPYRGSMKILPDASSWEVLLVNEVDLEEYVACVVTSEYGLDDLEGSKAMAVLARTYAVRSMDPNAPYDISDHTMSQVYRGSEGVTDLARRAARETEGLVLTYRGAPIEAVYFSSSGGITANNDDVWDANPLPYLRGKEDPFDTSSPHQHWRAKRSRNELLDQLSDRFGSRVSGFVIGQRSPDGRVARVELLLEGGNRREISANAFRLAVTDRFGVHSVRSTLFDVRREGDVYVFEGSGFGHGVGLSQWGAHEMARRGKSYDEILSFYFDGVEIGRLDGLSIAAASSDIGQAHDLVEARAAFDQGESGHQAAEAETREASRFGPLTRVAKAPAHDEALAADEVALEERLDTAVERNEWSVEAPNDSAVPGEQSTEPYRALAEQDDQRVERNIAAASPRDGTHSPLGWSNGSTSTWSVTSSSDTAPKRIGW